MNTNKCMKTRMESSSENGMVKVRSYTSNDYETRVNKARQ
jgi:hypothetical protein